MGKSLQVDREGEKMSVRQLSQPSKKVLGQILQSWRHRAVLLASGVVYWFVYAPSAGMFQYYQMDLTPLLKTSPVPNPYFFIRLGSFIDLYNSGMVWYPTGYLQINLLFGMALFSLLLSGLFGLNILLLVYNARNRVFRPRTGFGGIIGLIPALFSGGCCTVPLGILLVGSFVPSSVLFSFVYDYPILTNISIALLMLLSIRYASRKIGKHV